MNIIEIFNENIQIHKKFMSIDNNLVQIQVIAEKIIQCYKNNNKVLLCGNGGSAADAQHIAAELSGKFAFDRPPLYAEALHCNSSYITAVANDYSYNNIYSRLISANGKENDILLAFSTSGNSPNIIEAINTANNKKIITIGFTGENGGKMNNICNHIIKIPSSNTPRIQEMHILIGHIICQIVEQKLFKS